MINVVQQEQPFLCKSQKLWILNLLHSIFAHWKAFFRFLIYPIFLYLNEIDKVHKDSFDLVRSLKS